MPNTMGTEKWKALVIRAETSLAPWQDGLSARLKDMEKWLNDRYKPLTDEEMEEMMTPEVIINDNWTEEDERELQEAWLTHPTRQYIVHQTSSPSGYHLIAQSCKLITRMYRCPPQRIISRENGFRYQGSNSAAMSTPFCLQLAKVALHPFFQYRVSHLVIAIAWCVIARTNDRGPWGFSGNVTGDVYMRNLAFQFEPQADDHIPHAWSECKVTVRRNMDRGWKDQWLAKVSRPRMGGKVAAMGNTKPMQTDWARLLRRIEDLAGFKPDARPTERGSGPLVVTIDDLYVLQKALQVAGGFEQVPGPWDTESWFSVTKEVLNTKRTAPKAAAMRDLVLVAELHNLRTERYLQKNPEWPAYEQTMAGRARAAAGDIEAQARLGNYQHGGDVEDAGSEGAADDTESWAGFSSDDDQVLGEKDGRLKTNDEGQHDKEQEEEEARASAVTDDMVSDDGNFDVSGRMVGGETSSGGGLGASSPPVERSLRVSEKRGRQVIAEDSDDEPLNDPKRRRRQAFVRQPDSRTATGHSPTMIQESVVDLRQLKRSPGKSSRASPLTSSPVVSVGDVLPHDGPARPVVSSGKRMGKATEDVRKEGPDQEQPIQVPGESSAFTSVNTQKGISGPDEPRHTINLPRGRGGQGAIRGRTPLPPAGPRGYKSQWWDRWN